MAPLVRETVAGALTQYLYILADFIDFVAAYRCLSSDPVIHSWDIANEPRCEGQVTSDR